jgi:hypothetical protein
MFLTVTQGGLMSYEDNDNTEKNELQLNDGQVEQTEIICAVEGRRPHCGINIGRQTTVKEFAVMAAKIGGFEEVIEVFVEDADDPLDEAAILVEQLTENFSPIHVATHHKIEVTVEYNGNEIHRNFRPGKTIESATKWAIGPEGFKLEGAVIDFQLKYKGEVQPPDRHLGQVGDRKKKLKFVLVFKVKPQGDA